MIEQAADVRLMVRAQNRATRAAVRAFVAGMRDGDMVAVVDAIDVLDTNSAWRAAFAACARLPAAHADARVRFLELWLRLGDFLRCEVGDDGVFISGLRVLLPAYTGPAMTLYRGDTARARRFRAYGPSWTTDRTVAESHATNKAARGGGSVVLRTVAPPDAIISAPALLTDSFSESEFIVDRRRLRRVDVVARFE